MDFVLNKEGEEVFTGVPRKWRFVEKYSGHEI